MQVAATCKEQPSTRKSHGRSRNNQVQGAAKFKEPELPPAPKSGESSQLILYKFFQNFCSFLRFTLKTPTTLQNL